MKFINNFTRAIIRLIPNARSKWSQHYSSMYCPDCHMWPIAYCPDVRCYRCEWCGGKHTEIVVSQQKELYTGPLISPEDLEIAVEVILEGK